MTIPKQATRSAQTPVSATPSVQARGGTSARAGNQDLLQAAKRPPAQTPDELVDSQRWAMGCGDFTTIATQLYRYFFAGGQDYSYIDGVFEALPSGWEDNVAAEFVNMLDEERLDSFAASFHGRATLTTLYDAMITGSVSDFERTQAERILTAKTRQMKPEDFLASTKHRPGGGRTLIFPVRDMRITPGYDDAPLMAHLTKDGKVNVEYPVRVLNESTFRAETATLPDDVFSSDGMDLNPNEIVGIKDYESGGVVEYRPALALIDYANRVEHSTLGKIAQVIIASATLGAAGPEMGAGELLEEGGTKWAARLALADRVANVVQVVSFFVNENRDWLIEHLGGAGRALVRVTEVADSVVAVYGLGRLGHAGYTLARDLRRAAKAAKEAADAATGLDADTVAVLDQIDQETEKLAQDMDQAAATDAGRATAPATGTGDAAVPQPVETRPVETQPVESPREDGQAPKTEKVESAKKARKSTRSGGTARKARGPKSKVPGPGEVTFENIERIPGMRRTVARIEKYIYRGGGSWKELGFDDQRKFLEFVNRDPEAAVRELNRTLDIKDVRAEAVGSPGERTDGTHTVHEAPPKWDREQVLGKTPGKYSKTGRTVRERMMQEGKLKVENGQEVFFDRRTRTWYPVDSSGIHMGHTKDAVTWWNEKGRFFGPRSPEVRAWMTNSDNYELEYGPANSAAGARIDAEYLPPVGPGIDTSHWPNPYQGDD
jgi:hypothetical protein